MAQIKRNFLKSKMNKDLDARLIPNGEYREARNINISKSEGSDVGALENINRSKITLHILQFSCFWKHDFIFYIILVLRISFVKK